MARNIGLSSRNQTNSEILELECDEVIKVSNLSAPKVQKILSRLESGDRVTILSLEGWNLSEADLISFLTSLHEKKVYFSTLDGLDLPPNSSGKNVLSWISSLRKVRSAHHSKRIADALKSKPRETRKIGDNQKDQFLSDAKNMKQADLAEAYGVSIATVKNYLKMWKD